MRIYTLSAVELIISITREKLFNSKFHSASKSADRRETRIAFRVSRFAFRVSRRTRCFLSEEARSQTYNLPCKTTFPFELFISLVDAFVLPSFASRSVRRKREK